MIHQIEVRGFKRFDCEQFAFAPLTVLAGLNGSGKTSLLQSILIAYEASTSNSSSLRLNGPFGLQLGTAEDVLNWHSKPPIELSMDSHKPERATWRFEVPSDDALYLHIESRPDSAPIAFSQKARTFTYLSAERFGPRSFLGTLPVPDDELEIGVQGEHCAHVLSVLGNKVIEKPDRSHPSRKHTKPTLLKYEVEQWLSEIACPVEITAERYPGSSVTELRFKAPGAQAVRAPNMGFGISYALPVVLGGLLARSGGLFVVENPEAHLHPSGQSRIGAFLAWLAGRGVQVLLETHSDHVVNGIRLAIAEHRFLTADSGLVHFFGPTESKDDSPQAVKLTFNDAGSVSHWPHGFFDQYQIDVASLGRIRRQQ